MRSVVWVLLTLCLLCSSTLASDYIFVDWRSSCTTDCGGSRSRAFSSIRAALNYVFDAQFDGVPTIEVEPGVYTGLNNANLIVRRAVSIQSAGAQPVVMDCQRNGWGMVALNIDSLRLTNIAFNNCRSDDVGGGLRVENIRSVQLTSVVFTYCFSHLGGAIYADGVQNLALEYCTLRNNHGLLSGGALEIRGSQAYFGRNTRFECNWLGPDAAWLTTNAQDLFCTQNSELISYTRSGVICIGCRATDLFVFNDICQTPSSCVAGGIPLPEMPNSPCGDGVCDLASEDCLNCPADCKSCLLDGVRQDTFRCAPDEYSNSCLASVSIIPSAMLDTVPAPVIGRLFSYFQVSTDGTYSFRLAGANIGARLIINERTYVDAYFQTSSIDSTAPVRLWKGYVNTLEVHYFTLPVAVDAPSPSLLVSWGPAGSELREFKEGYYTIGDITANNVRQFYRDPVSSAKAVTASGTCGDNICQESRPERCIHDCYDEITPVCSVQAIPPAVTGPYKFDDTIGSLIKNQYLYRFPGLDTISHGVDIITGDPLATPLFAFTFCDNTSLSTVQDSYTGLTYTVPPEVTASMAIQCSFQSTTTEYSNSLEMSQDLAESASVSASANAGTRVFGIDVKLGASFSYDKSVQSARAMESTNEGSLFSTEAKCQVSKVQIAKNTFHPQFIRDVAEATTPALMLEVVKKYGSHYYKSAVLGGKLRQITIVSYNTTSSMGSSSVKESAQIQFAASVSSPSFSVTADFFGSVDSDIDEATQFDFERSTTATSVLTYGGPPGSYSPAPDSGAATFEDWAKGVMYLPVPIEYELDAIGNIIPAAWTTPDGKLYSDIWAQAEILFYNSLPVPVGISKPQSKYILQWYYSFEYTNRLPYDTDMFTTLTLEGDGTSPCATTLMDTAGAPVTGGPTYTPALWDNLQTVTSKGERLFFFNCSSYSSVTRMTAEFQGSRGRPTTGQYYMQADSVVLYDVPKSRSYYFEWLAGSGFTPFVLLPKYTHGVIKVRFAAVCLANCVPYSVTGATQPTISDFDTFILRVRGSLNELSYVANMNTGWPRQANGAFNFELSVPDAQYTLGNLQRVTFQSFTSRELNSIKPLRDPQYRISNVSLAVTYCPDGITQTAACASDTRNGFTRIFSTELKGTMTRLGSPLTFALLPHIPSFFSPKVVYYP